MLLDISQHDEDFFSPPGGGSPDAESTKSARPTAETLKGAAAAVRSATANGRNGTPVADGPSSHAPGQLPPMHPSPVHTATARRVSSTGSGHGSAGASPTFSASGPARFSGTSGKVCLRILSNHQFTVYLCHDIHLVSLPYSLTLSDKGHEYIVLGRHVMFFLVLARFEVCSSNKASIACIPRCHPLAACPVLSAPPPSAMCQKAAAVQKACPKWSPLRPQLSGLHQR